MPMTGAEQLLLELINRARLDPLAEAARYGIDLNQNLSPGTLDGAARQVLAPNALLDAAATKHSLWMLATDTFSHTGAGGSAPWDRAAAEGYSWNTAGENISWRGTSAGTIDLNAAITAHHQGLFLSAGHRANLLNDAFREVGLSQEGGEFTTGGSTWRASMLTELFGRSGSSFFLTGVAYADRDGDNFYSIGEGTGGVMFSVGAASTSTASAGGYALAVAASSAVTVNGRANGQDFTLSIGMGGGNVKLDVVGGVSFDTSGSVRLIGGIAQARLLGVDDLTATGNGAANRLTGNAGDNRLDGRGGADTLAGGEGNDSLLGGAGDDTLGGGAGGDRLAGGAGNDLLTGGAGADRFVLMAGGGNDRVADLGLAQGDRLLLDDALWGGAMTAAQVLASFGHVAGSDLMLDFGTAILTITGGAGLAALHMSIDII